MIRRLCAAAVVTLVVVLASGCSDDAQTTDSPAAETASPTLRVEQSGGGWKAYGSGFKPSARVAIVSCIEERLSQESTSNTGACDTRSPTVTSADAAGVFTVDVTPQRVLMIRGEEVLCDDGGCALVAAELDDHTSSAFTTIDAALLVVPDAPLVTAQMHDRPGRVQLQLSGLEAQETRLVAFCVGQTADKPDLTLCDYDRGQRVTADDTGTARTIVEIESPILFGVDCRQSTCGIAVVAGPGQRSAFLALEIDLLPS